MEKARMMACPPRAQAAQDGRRSLFQSLSQMLVQLPSVRKAVQDGADLRARDLLPPHRIYLDAYWIDQYPVTVARSRLFCQATGRQEPPPARGVGRTTIPSST